MKAKVFILCILNYIITFYAQAQTHTQGRIVYEVTFSKEFFAQSKKQLEYNNLKQKHLNRLSKSKELTTEIAPDGVFALFPKIQQEHLFFKKDTAAYWSAPVISSSRGDGHYDTLTGGHLKQGDSYKAMVIINVMNRQEVHISIKKNYPQPTKIRYKSGRKEILGFKCKKAILYYENKEKNSKWIVEIFYTKEIPNAYFFIKSLKGCPLQIINPKAGTTHTAKEVSFEPFPNEQFEIPKGYSLMIRN